MTDTRARIEQKFEILTAFLCTWRWWTLAVLAAIFFGFASGIPKLTIDTSTESFLRADDPILLQYNDFKDQFGREDLIIIMIEPDALFTRHTLLNIQALHEDILEGVPHVDEVTSMINVRNTVGEGDALVVDDLLAKWPQNDNDLADLRARVMASPLYKNQLISADGKVTTLVITLDAYSSVGLDGDELAGFDDSETQPAAPPAYLNDDETRDAVEAVQSIVQRHENASFRLQVAGMPSVTESLKRAIQKDMKKFMGMALLGIGICLFVMFRRVVAVALPLVVVLLSLISTMGLMGHAGIPVKVPTVILPSFLLAVSVGASVHVLAIFFQKLQAGEDRLAAIIHAMGHSGLAIVMTSLTTAVGLASFATAEVAPIADLGLFASIGTLLSLVYTVVLLPVLLSALPVRPFRAAEVSQAAFLDRILRRTADFSTGNAKAITITSATLLVIFLASASQMRFSHDVLAWLPSDWPVNQATRAIDEKLRGSVVVEVVVDTGRENGLYDREFLQKLDALAREIEAVEQEDLFVGKVFSVVDILKETHQALNENRPEFYAIPDNEKLIPQEFLLFENSGSDDLENVIDSRFQIARFTIRVPWRDALVYVPFIQDIGTRFERALGPDIGITKTGIMSILSRTLDGAIRSAAKSYLIAFGVITVMMVILVGSVKLGLASMLPNLTPIIVVMGGMLWLNIPLNLFTMLVGSIAIGLAVDDTVHFMHNFRRYLVQFGDVREAVRETLHTTGRAMLVTSVVLAIGFYIFLFATLNNVVHFGLLTGTAIILALIANFLMLPALMVLLIPRSEKETK